MNKSLLIKLLAVLGVLVVAAGIFLGYKAWQNNQTEKGMKEITVNVIDTVNGQNFRKTYTFKTNATMLGDALVANMNIETEGSSPNRYITGVDNIIADYTNNKEFWEILVNGTEGNYGMDSQPIKNGDVITLQMEVDTN